MAQETQQWSALAIGSPASGSASYDEPTDTYTVSGLGAGLPAQATADAFYAHLLQTEPNFSITAHLTGLQGPSSSEAGIFVRESIVSDAPMAWLGRSASGHLDFRARLSQGAGVVELHSTSDGLSTGWLRLDVYPGRIDAYTSNDQIDWTYIESVDLELADTITGVEAHSGVDTLAATATFTGTSVLEGIVPSGLDAQYWSTGTIDKVLISEQVDPAITFDWGATSPYAGMDIDSFLVEWSGRLHAYESGDYTFTSESTGDFSLWLNGTEILNSGTSTSGLVALEAGERYQLSARYEATPGDDVVNLKWSGPGWSDQILEPEFLELPPALIDGAMDNSDASVVAGSQWESATSAYGYYADNFLRIDSSPGSTASVVYPVSVEVAGFHEVLSYWPYDPGQSASVAVDITHSHGVAGLMVDQKTSGAAWTSLGFYEFGGTTGEKIVVQSTGDGAPVAADAFVLEVPEDSDSDGIPDELEILWFGDLSSADATSDQDGDGASDIDELAHGTAPNDPGSFPAEVVAYSEPVGYAYSGGTVTTSASAPSADVYDIYNYGAASGADKFWTGTAAHGQTFATGVTGLEIRSITYQVDARGTPATKTYLVRVGTLSGSSFTEIYSETLTQDAVWDSEEYMTWALAQPVPLEPNTVYAVDVTMQTSTTAWQDGIPYIVFTGNAYAGGDRYSIHSGEPAGIDTQSDRVFHIDLAPYDPSGGYDSWISGYDVGGQTGFDEDYDGDGLTNGEEFQADTDPSDALSDGDGDGLYDAWEILNFGDFDEIGGGNADGDGLTNLEEMTLGTDPNVASVDHDADGLLDTWEMQYFGDLAQTAGANPDGDDLSNLEEMNLGTDPTLQSSDHDTDGLPDAWELLHFGDLNQSGAGDADRDGLTNAEELMAGSDPAEDDYSPGTVKTSPIAPFADTYDIYNDGAATGDDKLWTGTPAHGQTFATGTESTEMRSITFQSARNDAQPSKTYRVRVGTLSGSTFTEIYSETLTQEAVWTVGDYIT